MKFEEGIYPIYKPRGWSSFQVVNFVKKSSGIRCVGHGGTLDPLGEGVLVVAVGRKFTRQLTQILKNSCKEYVAEILLDRKSDSYDVDGNVCKVEVKKVPAREQIENTLKMFIGEIEQLPPVYSAIKIKGKRACDIVRKNKDMVEKVKQLIKPKKVVISGLEVIEYVFPKLRLKICCSSGFYVRSLANDLGERLGCGGVVSYLLRTKVNDFKVEDCIKII